MKTIDFYFDFLSPFSYFAWINHTRNIDLEKFKIVYKPVLMGRLFSHFEFPGPGEITVKRNYELKKCFRYAAKNKIDFLPPSTFPFNPLAIIRCATSSATGENQFEVIDCIFKSIWAQGNILEDPELIQKILNDTNLDPNIVENSFKPDSKKELKANIKEALARKVFGVPTFAIGEEYFWGNDSFEDLNLYLSNSEQWDRETYDRLVQEEN